MNMERYHFNIEDGEAFQDREGTSLPSLHAARVEAAKILAQTLTANAQEFWQTERMEVNVTDGSGLTLFSVYVSARDAPALKRS
jgi:hypothetical protein